MALLLACQLIPPEFAITQLPLSWIGRPTQSATHRSPISTVAVIRPLCNLSDTFLVVGFLARTSPLFPAVARFPESLAGDTRWSECLCDRNPNKNSTEDSNSPV